MINTDLRELYSQAMRQFMESKCSNGHFFTKEEFNKNRGKIFIITGAKNRLHDKLKTL